MHFSHSGFGSGAPSAVPDLATDHTVQRSLSVAGNNGGQVGWNLGILG